MKDDFYHIRTNSGFSILGLIEGNRRMTIGKYFQKREFIQLSRGFSFGIYLFQQHFWKYMVILCQFTPIRRTNMLYVPTTIMS